MKHPPRKRYRALGLFLALATVVGCEPGDGIFGVSGGDAPPRTTVVFDTDMTFDDAVALLYLLRNEDVDLAAVTVTGTGIASLAAGVDNALRLLALAGNTDVIVAAGAEDSRSSGMTEDEIPDSLRSRADALLGVPLPARTRDASPDPVEVVLRDVLDAAKGDVVIVTTGPLTNLANSFELDPTIPERVTRIVTFGGAFQVPGNAGPVGSTDPPVAEWNMYLDPVAAEEVFSAGIPTDLVPLDAADAAPLTRAFVTRFVALADTAGRFVADGLSVLLADGTIDVGYRFFDPLAAVIAAEPEIAGYQVLSVRLVTVGDSIGRTLVDVTGDSLRVAVTVDRSTLENRLLDVLTGH